MGKIKQIALELINPNLESPPMWYKWATNQISHMALGVLSAWVLVTVVFLIQGEYPYKEALWALIFVAYFGKEILFDHWQKWDTVQDTLFFAGYGAGGAIMAFSENAVGEWAPRVNPYWLTTVLVVFSLHLVAGVLWRVKDDV